MGSHEENKADRRGRIIAAARDLIRETGRTGLSMRALAARAGVSLATPYNLFGSKRGVLEALLEANLQEFRHALSQSASPDPIDRILDVVSLAARVYVADQAFYRALHLALFEADNTELRRLYGPGRQQFWEDLVGEAIAADLLLEEVDPETLSRTIRYIFAGVLHDWATSGMDAARLEAEFGYGVSLALHGAVVPGVANRIRARLWAFQELVAQGRTAGPERVAVPQRQVTASG